MDQSGVLWIGTWDGGLNQFVRETDTFIRYQHDHVLDDMLGGFGLAVTLEMAPFEPESGAYGESDSIHAHQHEH